MMKHHILLLLCLTVTLLLTTVQAKKKLRRIGGRHGHKKLAPVPDTSAFVENDIDSEQLNEIETTDDLNQGIAHQAQYYDPCNKRHCSPGQICVLTDEGEPICICTIECPEETDIRRKVCSNLNETWESDCALNQMRCWCENGDDRCKNEALEHHHIEYYGPCKQIEECTEDQMLDFPRRMRDWLFHIMRDMADREELSAYYQKMERRAETNHTRRWAVAAVWKWCDLDSGHDRSVSRHELFPIKAPLMAMEHCISPFLDSCDANNDHKITLQEWTHCLELDEEDIEEQCEDIRDNDDSKNKIN